MSRYRKIDSRIWNDAKFRGLTDCGKLVFFMLLTHPNMTALGAMRGTVAGLAEEIGWAPEAFREAFQEALSKGMAEHDPKACFIALPNFIRYNKPESPNVIKAWVGALDLLPECALKTRTIARAKAITQDMSKGFVEAFVMAMPNPEPEPEPEQDIPPSPPKGGKEEHAPARTQREKKRSARVMSLTPIMAKDAQEAFARVWCMWPEKRPADGKAAKGNRVPAERAFQKILDSDVATAEELVDAAEVYLTESPLVRDGYLAYLSTFYGDEKGHWMEALRILRGRKALVAAQFVTSGEPAHE